MGAVDSVYKSRKIFGKIFAKKRGIGACAQNNISIQIKKEVTI